MRVLRAIVVLVLAASAVTAQTGRGGAGGGAIPPGLQYLVVELQHLTPTAALSLLKPYVRDPKGAVVAVDAKKIRILETSTTIDKMKSVLADEDRAVTGVVLNFELVHALDAQSSQTKPPARRSSVDSVLRSVLRFGTYDLLGTSMTSVGEHQSLSQTVAVDSADVKYSIDATIGLIRANEGTVHLTVSLARSVPTGTRGNSTGPNMFAYPMSGRETIIRTGLDVPIGQSVVLGTTAVSGMSGALVLVVRPEFLPSVKRRP